MWTSAVLWQVIANIMPFGFGRHKYMLADTDTRVIVQAPGIEPHLIWLGL